MTASNGDGVAGSGLHRMGDERAATMVEFALLLPLVMSLLLGLFTGGIAYFQKISLVDAAREGARYGASLKVEAASGGLAGWRQSVKDRVVQLSGDQLSAANVCVELVTPTGGNTACGVGDPPGSAADPTVLAPASLVKVSASRQTTIETILFTSTPTLSAEVVARYERDVA